MAIPINQPHFSSHYSNLIDSTDSDGFKAAALAREKAAHSIANSLLTQIDTGKALLSLAKRHRLGDGDNERCVQSAKRIFQFTEEKLWKLRTQPADLIPGAA
jgi:hypothetical protein